MPDQNRGEINIYSDPKDNPKYKNKNELIETKSSEH